MEKTAYQMVEAQVGEAVKLWAELNDLEATKRSGPQGAILFDVEYLCRHMGWTQDELAAAAGKLLVNGLARLTDNGRFLKAA